MSILGGVGGVTHYKRWQEPIGPNQFSGGNAPTIAQVKIRPFQVEYERTLDRLAFRVQTANGNGRVCIYADNGDTPVGGAVIVESVSVALVVGVQEVVIADTSLTEGLYWMAVQFDDNTASISRSGTDEIVEPNATLFHRAYARGGGYGAFTDPCPAAPSTAFPWVMYGRVASVP